MMAAIGAVFEFAGTKRQSRETITILRGQNVFQIAEELKAEGYIKSKLAFLGQVWQTGNLKNLKSGEYDFKGDNLGRIIEKLASADTVARTATIIPGQTLADISHGLEKYGISRHEFLNLAKIKSWQEQFDFLQGAPPAADLEGFLFPDTYELAQNPNADNFVKAALENFGKKFTSPWRQEIQKQNKTIFETILMASMLEKEVKTLEDKKIVAGILYKRLNAKMPLQVDSTVMYVNNGKFDKELDSPYNTYKFAGLPPGPICNPGMDSIEAAIEPIATDYWYYLSAPDGATIFSKTYDQHLINVAKHLDN